MEQFYLRVKLLRKKCENYSLEFEKEYGSGDYRTACFNIGFNKSTLTVEQVSYYRHMWKNAPSEISKDQIEQNKKDNWERCVEVTRALFIGIFSAIEYTTRNAIIEEGKEHPLASCVNRKKRLADSFDKVYEELDKSVQKKLNGIKKKIKDTPPYDSFSRIIGKSLSEDLINKKDSEIWRFLTDVRNCTVHNNVIGWKNRSVKIEGEKYQMKKGEMTQGKMDFYVVLMNKMLDLSRELFKKI